MVHEAESRGSESIIWIPTEYLTAHQSEGVTPRPIFQRPSENSARQRCRDTALSEENRTAQRSLSHTISGSETSLLDPTLMLSDSWEIMAATNNATCSWLALGLHADTSPWHGPYSQRPTELVC